MTTESDSCHRIRLPKPHGKKQEIIMSAFFTPGLSEMWIPCGTKFGKSIAAAAALSGKAAVSPGSLFRWVAPIYSQTKIGFKYCQRILPRTPHTEINKSEPSLTLRYVDSKLEFRSGKFAEDLEGEACHGYVLDESAKMSEAVYDSAKTTTTVTRGPIIAISTPRGKNWFYTKCMQAKEEMEWSLRRGEVPRKLYLTAPSAENPAVTADAIEEARRNLPDRLFRQYYLADFVDDGSVFVGFRDCLSGPPLELNDARQTWCAEGADQSAVVVGVDWAKTVDFTVFVALDIEKNRLVGFERFQKCPYTEAIRRLVLFGRKFREVQTVMHDKTGVGGAIDDQLSYTDLPAEGVTFSNASKSEMVTKLITSMEQAQIQLPRWAELIDELEAYEVSTTATGQMCYSAPPGKHDDIVSALMLANAGLLTHGFRDLRIRFLEDMPSPDDEINRHPIMRYYRGLAEEDDDEPGVSPRQFLRLIRNM